MALRDHLTNEYLKGIFKNNFELANYAIQNARRYIQSGHETSLDEILVEIYQRPPQLEEKNLGKIG